ncbi:MAG: hypothetical protein ABW195_17255 [Ilumatobacteraceae bacterium]
MNRLASALCGIAASTTALGLLVSLAPAAAAQDAPGGVALVLADQTFAVAPDGSWRVVLDVSGSLDSVLGTTTTTTTTEPPAEGTPETETPTAETPTAGTPTAETSGEVRVLARRPVATRADLTAVVEGRRLPVTDTVTFPLDAVRSSTGGTDRLTLDVATAVSTDVVDALTLPTPGLYPVAVQVLVDGDVVAEHDTFLERLTADGDDGAPMNIAIVGATPDPGPAATAAELAAGRRRVAEIAALAAAVDGPITVAIPPVLLAGLAAADPALDAVVRSSFDGDEVLAAPADVLDPSSAVAIDQGDAFTRDLLRGEDALDGALAVRATRETGWLVPAEISTDATMLLRNLGFRSLVLTREVYADLDGSIAGYFDTTLSLGVDIGNGASFPAKVIDASSDMLVPASLTDSDGDPSATDAAVNLIARLVTIRRELGADLARSVVLLPPDGVVPDPDISGRLAAFVDGLPAFDMAPLSALPGATDPMLIDGVAQEVTLPDRAGPDLGPRSERIELTRVAAVSAGSMLVDDDRSASWNAELDTLLSTGLDDEQATAGMIEIAGEANAVIAQVSVPRPFTFTLTGRSSPLRLNIRSSATVPLQVVVSPSSAKLTFPEGPQVVELNPEGATEVAIPVEARSNGTSSLTISVVTPTFGRDVTDPLVLTARVNALTGLGQVVTGAAVLVLVSWWYGHFRRRRRRRLALVGELDGPPRPDVDLVSPDAAEATAARPADDVGADSVSDP